MQFAEHVLTVLSNNFISRGNAEMMKAGIKVGGDAGEGLGGGGADGNVERRHFCFINCTDLFTEKFAYLCEPMFQKLDLGIHIAYSTFTKSYRTVNKELRVWKWFQ